MLSENTVDTHQSELNDFSPSLNGSGGKTVKNGAIADNPVATAYDRQLERAKVREAIRSFVEGIKASWQTLPDGLEESHGFSNLDNIMKYKTLTSFRSRWFLYFLSLKVVAASAAVLAAALLATFWTGTGSDLASNLIVSFQFRNFLFLAFVAGVGLPALRVMLKEHRHKLERVLEQYRSGLFRQASKIELRISEYITNESGESTNSRAKLNNFASTIQEANTVREGLIEIMFSWRKLERMSYYLRHEWDTYYNGVLEERQLPNNSSSRIVHVSFWTIVLAVASGLSLVAVFLVIKNGDALPTILPTALTTMSLMLFSFAYIAAVANAKEGILAVVRHLILLVAAVAIPPSLLGVTIHSMPERAMFISHLYVSFGLYVAITNILAWDYARRAGDDYKRIADMACVKIISALKTHQKSDIIEKMGIQFQDFLKLDQNTNIVSPDWNGWTQNYEGDLREMLRTDGSMDESEIDARIAADPLIYVGEETNRRIQVSLLDPTLDFVRKFPHVRTVE